MVTALAEAMPAFTEDGADGADGNVDTILVTALTNLLESVTVYPDSWRLLMLATDDTPPEVRDHIAAGREFALQRLRALLNWGRDRQVGLAELDLEIAVQSLLAVGEQAVRLVLTDPEQFTPHRYARFARSLLGSRPT
jgi:hypothetical protein